MSAFMDNVDGEYYDNAHSKTLNLQNSDGNVIDSYSAEDGLDNSSVVNIKWKEGGIKCPVSKCNLTFCTTKQSFARHWEETHRRWSNYQKCPKCHVEMRRFIELQQHMRQKHGLLEKDFSTLLPSVKVIRKINDKYIDPGPYRPPLFPSSLNNHISMRKLLQNSTDTGSSSGTSNGNSHKKSNSAKESPSSNKSASSVSLKRKSSSSSSSNATAVIKPKVDRRENVKSEPRSPSSKLPIWSVPEVPSSKQPLVDYLKWADSVICQVGNARLEAKRKLDALEADSELHKERQLRKKLEKELESKKAELEALRHLSDYTSFNFS